LCEISGVDGREKTKAVVLQNKYCDDYGYAIFFSHGPGPKTIRDHISEMVTLFASKQHYTGKYNMTVVVKPFLSERV
jgi:hypothetical protein